METDPGGQSRPGGPMQWTHGPKPNLKPGEMGMQASYGYSDPKGGHEVGGQSQVPPELQRWSDAVDAKYGAPAGMTLALFYAVADMAFIPYRCRENPHSSAGPERCMGKIQNQTVNILGNPRGPLWDKYGDMILRALNNDEYATALQKISTGLATAASDRGGR